MNKDFALHLAFNPLSFGVVSTALAREICRRNLNPCIFPIGNPDLTAQQVDQNFGMWLQNNINKSFIKHNRNTPVIKLWHINDSLASFSNTQHLVTFHETDSLSPIEVNILKNQKTVFVTSHFSKQVFEESGLSNVEYLPLGFDKDNFAVIDRPYIDNSVIVFLMAGKFEQRKAHARMLNSWAKQYGNNRNYRLHCALYNSFISPEDNQRFISQALEGKQYWNMTFLGPMKTNAEYNDFLNSGQIMLAMSGGEGFNLPLFHALGLGKHAVVLDAHAHKDFCNKDNSVLVRPNGKVRAVDGIFFQENSPFNNGNFFTYSDEDFVNGMQLAVERVKQNRVNTAGLQLQNRTYKETVDALLAVI